MIVYILAFIISILLIWISEKKVKSRKLKILLKILAVLPFFVISAIRYDVGTDYIKRYTTDYLTLAKGQDVTNLEIIFKLLVKFCLIFTQEPYILFVITSLIIVGIFYQTIYTRSKNPILSITIFLLGGYFFASLNLVRQYMAVAFVLLGYQCLLSEDKKKAYIGFSVCAILAFFTHSASIVSFVILFLAKKILANPKWVLPVTILVLVLNENLMSIITPIIEQTRFSVYLSGKFAKGEVSILNIAVNIIIYLWMYVIYLINKKQNIELDKEGILFFNIQGLALLITVAGTIHMQFMRIAIYFWIFQILSIPYFLSIMPFGYIADKINNKIKKNLKEKTIKTITYAAVAMCFVVMFSYTNILNNDNGVLPYKTVFSIDKTKNK